MLIRDYEVDIKKEDMMPLIYFIVSMFQQENTHRQGTSAKNDLIGGYLDRWINKIPENIFFNKLLFRDKAYEVVNDYYIYGPQTEKNAPDILGIKKDTSIINFAEFEDKKWNLLKNMPHVEVKTFRKNQKLVSVRDGQLCDDNYYVFIESNFKPDYLIQLFDKSVFDECNKEKIMMDDTFVKSDCEKLLQQPKYIMNNDDSIGSIKLISIIKGSDYKENSLCCVEKEHVYYVKDISKVERIRGANSNCTLKEYLKDGEHKGLKLIPIISDNLNKIIVKKINKKSIYIQPEEDSLIYEYKVEKDKIYKIDIEEFERNSKWTEFVALKNQFINKEDRTNELVDLFDKIAEDLD